MFISNILNIKPNIKLGFPNGKKPSMKVEMWQTNYLHNVVISLNILRVNDSLSNIIMKTKPEVKPFGGTVY
jgi:hypothetical protein